jgi:hypothetical protein
VTGVQTCALPILINLLAEASGGLLIEDLRDLQDGS